MARLLTIMLNTQVTIAVLVTMTTTMVILPAIQVTIEITLVTLIGIDTENMVSTQKIKTTIDVFYI